LLFFGPSSRLRVGQGFQPDHLDHGDGFVTVIGCLAVALTGALHHHPEDERPLAHQDPFRVGHVTGLAVRQKNPERFEGSLAQRLLEVSVIHNLPPLGDTAILPVPSRLGPFAPRDPEDDQPPSASLSRAICSAIGRGGSGVFCPRRPSTFSKITTGPGPAKASAAPARHASAVSKA